VIEIKNISVIYRSGERKIPALSSVNLAIENGEFLSVMGPNGSGKSTLVKALCGLVELDEGGILINGSEVVAGGFPDTLFGKIGVVFQEPSGQFLMPSVRKEIEAVLENLGLDYPRQLERFEEIVDKFQLDHMLQIPPDKLSPGQMQIVNLAVAFTVGSEVLILDEPTTFLDFRARRLFLDHIKRINDDGRTVIHVTQYTDEALRSQKTCLMDSGCVAAVGESRRVLSDEKLLARCRLSLPVTIEFENQFGFGIDDREQSSRFASGIKLNRVVHSIGKTRNKPVLLVDSLAFSYRESGFSLNIDKLRLNENQVVGLVGASGSGKSTLALLLAGIIKPHGGGIEYHNKIPLQDRYSKFVGLSWQMPDPVLIGPTVENDLRLALSRLGENDTHPDSLLEVTGMKGFEDRIVDTLSGGEKRKLSLASVLAARPGYLILDEPAAFLDPVSQEELKNVIKTILPKLIGALIIGHDLVFLSELVDRIIGIKNGAIAFDLPAPEFFSNVEYGRDIGLGEDPMITFRQTLLESGIELPVSTLRPAEIMRYLKKSSRPADDFS